VWIAASDAAKALVAPGRRRQSLREIATELKAKGFQNWNGRPFSGSVVAKVLKVNDVRLRKAAAMKEAHSRGPRLILGRIASGSRTNCGRRVTVGA
jgi:hypothetical protein